MFPSSIRPLRFHGRATGWTLCKTRVRRCSYPQWLSITSTSRIVCICNQLHACSDFACRGTTVDNYMQYHAVHNRSSQAFSYFCFKKIRLAAQNSSPVTMTLYILVTCTTWHNATKQFDSESKAQMHCQTTLPHQVFHGLRALLRWGASAVFKPTPHKARRSSSVLSVPGQICCKWKSKRLRAPTCSHRKYISTSIIKNVDNCG